MIESDKLTSETTAGKDHIEIGSDGYIRSVVAQAEKWRLSADGSGMLASGAISWTTAGDLTVNKITATSGTIAGWNIDKNYLYVGTKQTGNAYTTSGITIFANGSSAAIRAKNFRIDTDGSAYFKGTVNATAGSFGNWHIDGAYIYSGAKQTSDTYATSGITLYAETINGVEYAALRGVNFRIDTNGNAYFKGSGEFSGKITASEGAIGGWTIGTDNISGGSTYLNKAGDIYCEKNSVTYWKLAKDGTGSLAKGNISWNANGDATFKGALSGATGSFSGSITASDGKIGGWTINESHITKNDVYLGSNGDIYCQYGGIEYWRINNYGKATFAQGKTVFNSDGSGYVADGRISWDTSGKFTIHNGKLGQFAITQIGDTIEPDMAGSLVTYYTIVNGTRTVYDSLAAIVQAGRLNYCYRTFYRASGGIGVQQYDRTENGVYYFHEVATFKPNGDTELGSQMHYFKADGSGQIGTKGNYIVMKSDGTVTVNGASSGKTGQGVNYEWSGTLLRLGTIPAGGGDTDWGDYVNLKGSTGQGVTYGCDGTQLRFGTIPAGGGKTDWGDYVNLKGDKGTGVKSVSGTLSTGDEATSTYTVWNDDDVSIGKLYVKNGSKGSKGDNGIISSIKYYGNSSSISSTYTSGMYIRCGYSAVTTSISNGSGNNGGSVYIDGVIAITATLYCTSNPSLYSKLSVVIYRIRNGEYQFQICNHSGSTISVTAGVVAVYWIAICTK